MTATPILHGTALYEYEATNYHENALNTDNPKPPTSWTLRGCPRNFSSKLDDNLLTADNEHLKEYFNLSVRHFKDSSLQ